MVYDPITSTEIASGKPVTSTTMGKVKDDLNDHEARIQDLESGSSVAYPPIIMNINGGYGGRDPRNDLLQTTVNFNITILGVRIYIQNAGSSGITEIMLRRFRPGFSNDDILSSPLSADFSDGDDFLSAGASLDPSFVDIDAGDIIALDLTSVQFDADTFFVRIDYEKRA